MGYRQTGVLLLLKA